MNELALFSGAGGGILGGKLLGWTTVAAVEIEKYPREILLQRQRDGILPRFPIWDDIRSFDGRPWRGFVDVVSGGFPCQDISAAGKGAGIEGSRSGLWAEMHRIVCEVRPRYVFVENSPALTSRGLGRVLGDLAASGYDAAWLVLGAADVGAPHRRDRIWILAEDSERGDVFSHSELHGDGWREQQQEGVETAAGGAASDADSDGVQCSEQGEQYERSEESARGGADGVESRANVAYSTSERLQESQRQRADLPAQDAKRAPDGASRNGQAEGAFPHALQQWQGRQQCGKEVEAATSHAHLSGCDEQRRGESAAEEHASTERCGWWSSEPAMGRVAHGVAHRVDRLKSLGNGQVPLVAAVAFKVLRKVLEDG